MPEGEEMFRYHGYRCNCPEPPMPKPMEPTAMDLADEAEAIAASVS
jgi:hypothetical protein